MGLFRNDRIAQKKPTTDRIFTGTRSSLVAGIIPVIAFCSQEDAVTEEVDVR
jgi:hypothetical protein